MDKQAVEDYLSGLAGAEGVYPFGPEALVFKVMGKMFALVSQQEAIPRVTLKCDPGDGAALVGQFDAITPGYYMNKKHWISIGLDGEVPLEMVKELSQGSYELVVTKLTQKDRKTLQDMA